MQIYILQNGDFPCIHLGDPPPSKSDKTLYTDIYLPKNQDPRVKITFSNYEYGRMKALIKSMENNDKGAIYLMLLSNTDNLLSVWDNLLSVAIVI